MNCKVCGNAVNNNERVCNVCGNDMEVQRREAAGTNYAPKPPSSFFTSSTPPPAVSLLQEKEEAINRILYDGEGTSAKDRLEERRKKRQAEKAASHTGFPSFFSHERKEQPEASVAPAYEQPEAPVAPAYEQPEAPVAPAYEPPLPAYEPPLPEPVVEERPKRNFSNEFIFGETKKFASSPGSSDNMVDFEPEQQTFAIPQVPIVNIPPIVDSPKYQETPAYVTPDLTPATDSYFALTPSDEEQAKFNVDKKNEEFQELLDKEFERLKKRESEPIEIQSQFEKETENIGPQSDTDIRSYIQDRIDSYLKQKDLDMAFAVRSRAEELSQPRKDLPSVSAPIPEPVPYQEPVFAPIPEPAPYQEPVFAPIPEPAPYQEPVFAPIPEPAPYQAPEPAQIPEPAPYQEPEPAPIPEPVSEFLTTPETEPVPSTAPAPSIVSPGGSRNAPPTRESIAEFLDQPIKFPFDTPYDSFHLPGIETGPTAQTFDFEPIETKAPVSDTEISIATEPEPFVLSTQEALPVDETTQTDITSKTAEIFAAPFSFDRRASAPSTEFQSVAGISGTDTPMAMTDAPAPEIVETESLTFADLEALTAAPKKEDPSNWFTSEQKITEAVANAEIAPEQDMKQSEWFVTRTPAVSDSFTTDKPVQEETQSEMLVAPAPSSSEQTDAVFAQEPLSSTEFKAEPQTQLPDFVDLMTDKTVEDIEEQDDGPPKFYKEYTQGFSVSTIEAAEAAAALQNEIQAGTANIVPEFLTAYDNEQLGTTSPESKSDAKTQDDNERKKRITPQKQSDIKRTALSIVITILIIILVIVIVCIIILKLAPDSIGAYYITDAIEIIQNKLGIGDF